MYTYREEDTCNVFIFYQNIEVSSSKRPIFVIIVWYDLRPFIPYA